MMGSTTHNLLQGKNKYRQKGNDEQRRAAADQVSEINLTRR